MSAAYGQWIESNLYRHREQECAFRKAIAHKRYEVATALANSQYQSALQLASDGYAVGLAHAEHRHAIETARLEQIEECRKADQDLAVGVC